jgi:SAM-dependent methyltransferase
MARCPCPREGCPLPAGDALLHARISSTRRELALRLCDGCGAAAADPWPTAAEIATLYSADYAYHDPTGDQPEREAASLKFALARWKHRRFAGAGASSRLLEWIAGFAEALANKTASFSLGVPLALPPGAAMLDYGCGSGLWLRAMRRRGFSKLYGYDVSLSARVARLLESEGIGVVDEEGLDSLRGRLDLVRLEHVFEHLVEPIDRLSRLRWYLRPDGWLVMTFPSIYPWLGREDLAGPNCRPHLQFPMHVVLHSLRSATEWVEAAGFRVVGVKRTRRERFLTLAARPDSRSTAR